MKRKIQTNFKSYQKILLLILILLATLLFGFINGSYITVEGLLIKVSDESNETSVAHHKAAAINRSSGDAQMSQDQEDNYTINAAINR
uniref:Uncharacterized protein n=1 Tax=viral metagenome TaxID=1070528 RepID=A0A6C0KR37_9ZZZZ